MKRLIQMTVEHLVHIMTRGKTHIYWWRLFQLLNKLHWKCFFLFILCFCFYDKIWSYLSCGFAFLPQWMVWQCQAEVKKKKNTVQAVSQAHLSLSALWHHKTTLATSRRWWLPSFVTFLFLGNTGRITTSRRNLQYAALTSFLQLVLLSGTIV